MKLSRLASVDHPLALQFHRAFASLSAGLQWDSARPYRGTVRNFLIYLGDNHFLYAPRTGAEVRVENMEDSYWIKRYNGARRIIDGN